MDDHRRRTSLLRAGLGLLLTAALILVGVAPAHAELQRIDLPADLRPEGITSGPGDTFYVGSLADGRILTGDLSSGDYTVLLPGATGRQIRGLYYDHRSRLVWAVGNAPSAADPAVAEGHIWAVHSRTGAVVSDTVVPGAVFLNDLVVTRTAVWVTDSRVDRLTRIALRRDGLPGRGEPQFLTLSGAWPAYNGSGIAANGIRALRDGSLVLNHSTAGGLWRVNPRTGFVREIPVIGGPGIVGGDGLDRRGRLLLNVRGSGPNQVAVLRLFDTKRFGVLAVWVTALTASSLDVPSTATINGNRVYAVNARFGTATPENPGYWITPLKLPGRR